MPVLKNKEEWAFLTGEERLDDWIRYHYGLDLVSVEPVGGVLKLETDQGFFVLKRVRMREKDRWEQIARLADFLSRQKGLSFTMPKPVPTKRKKISFDGYRYPYVLLPWLEGETPQLNKAEEWRLLSREMASFHLATAGFETRRMPDQWNRIGKWGDWWLQVYKEMEIFHLAARWTSVPTELDEIWRKVSHYSLGLMKNLLKYSGKTELDRLSLETAKYGNISHGRWHRRNLLIQPDGNFAFIDWNEMVADVRAADLADWLLYAYGRTQSPEVIKTILSGYQEASELTNADYALIYARLLFPGQLVRHLRNVYLNDKKPGDFTVRLVHQAILTEQKKTNLLKCYAQLVRNHFHASIPEIEWIHKKEDPLPEGGDRFRENDNGWEEDSFFNDPYS
ncbi:phosphotransferase [Thermoactinomyces intermedius]|jgi:CotS family spore coat protein|uniref:Phosphotransferase n=1 Tax=Thermoactinomyces intermedius TaxID=2024 RepID=A0A8I1A7C0_THEIN|nr:phosphotransferase [Thermoactinomyces intermedius]MBA4549221.1 phosphotransferase [Thermoactinomyces intermedius]MBA4836166.1 phosphotransferase [Thermoactinomyces intermedius]MBH8595763.1 phosphotransferase [Thermoactinomyces intermedius]